MTSNYLDPIPPLGEDHIEYAIKRANHKVRQAMMDLTGDFTVISQKALGRNLYLVLEVQVDPYEESEEEEIPTKKIKRVIRRFTVAEVLAAKLPEGLTIAAVFDEETTHEEKVEAVVTALNDADIGVEAENLAMDFGTNTVTIKSIAKVDRFWFGEGTVKLIF